MRSSSREQCSSDRLPKLLTLFDSQKEPQPKVSDLLRGHFKGYSQERLTGLLTKLGMDVGIVVRAKRGRRQTGDTVSVVFA